MTRHGIEVRSESARFLLTNVAAHVRAVMGEAFERGYVSFPFEFEFITVPRHPDLGFAAYGQQSGAEARSSLATATKKAKFAPKAP